MVAFESVFIREIRVVFSQPETEAAFLELLIFAFVEAVETGGAMRYILLNLTRVHQQAHTEDLFPEIPFIERFFQDHFVKMLQLTESESRRQQFNDNLEPLIQARSFCEEGVQGQGEFRQSRAGQRSARTDERVLHELAILRLPINFNLLFWTEDEPAFFYACDGVGAKFRSIVIMAGHAYFHHQLGGARMLIPKILLGAANHGQVRLRLGVFAGDGLLAINENTRREGLLEQPQQPADQRAVKG